MKVGGPLCRDVMNAVRAKSKAEEEEILARWEEQIRNEVGTIQKSIERFESGLESMRDRQEHASLPAARRMMVQWYKPLVDALAEEQKAVRFTLGVHAWGEV